MKMIHAGIIGSGNIGTDLLIKMIKSKSIDPVIFVGRRNDSDGIIRAKSLGINTSIKGIEYFIENPNCCNLVFDCTNAFDAITNNKIFKLQQIKVIDLTPAKIGPMCVPPINGDLIFKYQNINMITCGGQTSIPILSLIAQCCENLKYIEIVSQISSKSAGIATRENIDQYIHTTEAAITLFTRCPRCKVILNINPAEPCVDMQTTMFVESDNINFDKLQEELNDKIKEVRKYAPYYEMVMMPVINEDGILILSIRVKGAGDYLPKYAGNLDIINCAAINIAELLL